MESQVYEVSISSNGSPVIDAAYRFEFNHEQPLLEVFGRRVVVFPFTPSWREPIIERLAWKTSILTAHDGTEQRIQLRQLPRHSVEYELYAEMTEASLLEATLWGWQARVYALPIWTEPTRLNKPLARNSLSIPIVTNNTGFHVGGLAVMLRDAFTVEAVEVGQVNTDSLILERPLSNSWPIGSFIYPARLARLPQQQSLSRLTAGIIKTSVQFEMAEHTQIEAKVYPVRYRDFAVLDKRPNWSQPMESDYLRKLTKLDYQVGVVTIDDNANQPVIVQSMAFVLENRDEIQAFRQWLYARAGRQQPT